MKKSYIIVIVICVIYVGVMYILFGNKNKVDFNDTYIITENSMLTFDENWQSFETNDKVFNDNKFKVYIDNIYQGEYFLRNYNDTWYFFDDNNESYDFSGRLFAYKSKNEFLVNEYEVIKASIDEINNVLKDSKITVTSDQLSMNEKVTFDFDGDGENENIYSLSTIPLGAVTDINTIFSGIYYEDNGKISKIKEDVGNIDSSDVTYFYDISNIIDLNNDKKYEIIVQRKKNLAVTYNCDALYELSGNNYKALSKC